MALMSMVLVNIALMNMTLMNIAPMNIVDALCVTNQKRQRGLRKTT